MAPDLANVEDAWASLSRQRLAWAFCAYDKFIDCFSDEIQEHLSKGDSQTDAFVIVIGVIKSGKTTVVLDLLGVTEDSLDRVRDVLRCGRKFEESATVTAMEYRRSTDQNWYFEYDGMTKHSKERPYDDAGLRVALGEELSKKRISAGKPIVVWIPGDCFDQGKKNIGNLRILDFPGSNAANDDARLHIIDLVEKYVNNADLILLVSNADNLSILKPEGSDLPGISKLQILPERFRIITTHSFSKGMLSEEVENRPNVLSADFLRERLLRQIFLFDSSGKADTHSIVYKPERFFPLDFGTAWKGAQPVLTAQLQPVIKILKEELFTDIEESAAPFARLRNAVDMHLTVERLAEIGLKRRNKSIEELKKKVCRAHCDVQAAEGAFKTADTEHEKAENILNNFPPEELKKYVSGIEIFNVANWLTKVKYIGTDRKKFRLLINDFKQDLKTKFFDPCANGWNPSPDESSTLHGNFLTAHRSLCRDFLPDVTKLIDNEFKPLFNKLNQYLLDEYYPRLFDDFENDKISLALHIERVAAVVASMWQKLAQQWRSHLFKDVESKKNNINDLSNTVTFFQKEYDKLLVEQDNLKQERQRFCDQVRLNKENSGKFFDLLKQAYFDELQVRYRGFTHASASSDAFIELLAIDQLINEYKTLVTHTSMIKNTNQTDDMTQQYSSQEVELKELLVRVMQDPLRPLMEQVKRLEKRLVEVEDNSKKIQDEGLRLVQNEIFDQGETIKNTVVGLQDKIIKVLGEKLLSVNGHLIEFQQKQAIQGGVADDAFRRTDELLLKSLAEINEVNDLAKAAVNASERAVVRIDDSRTHSDKNFDMIQSDARLGVQQLGDGMAAISGGVGRTSAQLVDLIPTLTQRTDDLGIRLESGFASFRAQSERNRAELVGTLQAIQKRFLWVSILCGFSLAGSIALVISRFVLNT